MSLIAVLKTKDLELVQECEIPLEQFPDMIDIGPPLPTPPGFRVLHHDEHRQFFRIGITDKKAFYREGVSYRISQ